MIIDRDATRHEEEEVYGKLENSYKEFAQVRSIKVVTMDPKSDDSLRDYLFLFDEYGYDKAGIRLDIPTALKLAELLIEYADKKI